MKEQEHLQPAVRVVAMIISLSMGASAIGLAGDRIESREIGGDWRSGSTMPSPLCYFDAAFSPLDHGIFVPGGTRSDGSIDGSVLH
jgi:hypothetical protein